MELVKVKNFKWLYVYKNELIPVVQFYRPCFVSSIFTYPWLGLASFHILLQLHNNQNPYSWPPTPAFFSFSAMLTPSDFNSATGDSLLASEYVEMGMGSNQSTQKELKSAGEIRRKGWGAVYI
jgi:hypothetical protein